MIRERFVNHPNILQASHCWAIPGSIEQGSGYLELNGESKEISYRAIDPSYMDDLEIPIIDGRNFREGNEADHTDSSDTHIRILLNESAINLFGLDNPVGTTGKLFNNTIEIIGVVKDFHYHSLKEPITPSCFIWNDFLFNMMLKIRGTDIASTMDFIEKEMNASVLVRDYSFKYHFLDETLRMQYQSEEHFLRLIGYFTILAIFIACLGLYGLSSFMSARRTKEMGIRKVNGASVFSIFSLLAMDFLKWILLSFILAIPIAIYAMNRWLQEFAYRTNLGVLVFIITVLLILFIVLLTVTWQSLKTARINPVESLRYE
jgi:putative ABC transport system permease protein